jgi:hypothetical protein
MDQIQWKSLLDTPLPANNFSQGSNNNSSVNVPPSASAVPYPQGNSNAMRD